MTADPYKSAPDRAFWSRSVARTFAPATVVDTPPFQLGPEDRFMSAGSCFASHVRRWVAQANLLQHRGALSHQVERLAAARHTVLDGCTSCQKA